MGSNISSNGNSDSDMDIEDDYLVDDQLQGLPLLQFSIPLAIVTNLSVMLDQHNVHAKAFRMAHDMLQHHNVNDLKLRIISDRQTDGCIYNKLTISEVATLIIGDIYSGTKRDIIIQAREGSTIWLK
ncbi:hypothetical protein KIW84_014930 [Lathyrus oleraceus]|uniref:Uncharacterized protein n=1 Tax=Pisum sativum TaxID=3888 RepID=A0A9D5BPD1_PEA|nr:hypothetical protein KIW84_014930 [Pisum sativum]